MNNSLKRITYERGDIKAHANGKRQSGYNDLGKEKVRGFSSQHPFKRLGITNEVVARVMLKLVLVVEQVLQ